jgi:ribosomal protein S18 acetylase RimI-like enzyme
MTRVRAAVPADAAAVAAVGRVAFTRQYEGLVDPANYTWAASEWYSDDAIEESIRQCERDFGAHFLVAERDGVIAGFLHYDDAGPQPELHRIYLAPEEQGQGIGGLLMDALHARLSPAADYILVVAEANHGAVRFYRSHGLREDRCVSAHRYYRDTAGIVFPAGARDFGCIVMRYGP